YVIDAEEQTLGRLSTEVASILRGKHKPTYTPHVDTGDYVIIINAGTVELTRNKLSQKVYYRHTGNPGGIKEITAGNLSNNYTDRIIETSVKGMLPKNSLGDKQLSKLFVYEEDTHPHAAQQPENYELRG